MNNILKDNREPAFELMYELGDWVTEQTGGVDNLSNMAYSRNQKQKQQLM